jgi:hypothetical protein
MPPKNTSENKLNKDSRRGNGDRKKRTKMMVQQPAREATEIKKKD